MSDPSPSSSDPSARKSIEQVRMEHQHLLAIPHLQQLLNAFPTPAVILNAWRQIVAANQRLCGFVDRNADQLLGMRIGEAFNCTHWQDGDCGCGTSQFCGTCGALHAIQESERLNCENIKECTISMRTKEGEQALDLRVTASSLDLDGRFTVFGITDIGDEKRRAVLERMFFHDVLNTAAAIRNLLEILPALSDQNRQETAELTYQFATYLIEEIEAGKDLAAAERGDLAVRVATVDARELLKSVCELYANHPVSRGRGVVVKEMSGPVLLSTDKLLLKRVLGNLVKNALEASVEGQEVSLDFENRDAALFRVHNDSAIPEEVQLQVFRRSFSTKSPTGRGIGTYSAKLITERYLGGSLSFTSSEEEGTTFAVTLPRSRQSSAFSSQQASPSNGSLKTGD